MDTALKAHTPLKREFVIDQFDVITCSFQATDMCIFFFQMY